MLTNEWFLCGGVSCEWYKKLRVVGMPVVVVRLRVSGHEHKAQERAQHNIKFNKWAMSYVHKSPKSRDYRPHGLEIGAAVHLLVFIDLAFPFSGLVVPTFICPSSDREGFATAAQGAHLARGFCNRIVIQPLVDFCCSLTAASDWARYVIRLSAGNGRPLREIWVDSGSYQHRLCLAWEARVVGGGAAWWALYTRHR